MNLRRQARGEACQVRAAGICNYDHTTTVAAHVRMVGLSGIGMKAPDWFTAFACSACHDYVDGRSHPEVSYEKRRLDLLEGMARTQVIRLRKANPTEAPISQTQET